MATLQQEINNYYDTKSGDIELLKILFSSI